MSELEGVTRTRMGALVVLGVLLLNIVTAFASGNPEAFEQFVLYTLDISVILVIFASSSTTLFARHWQVMALVIALVLVSTGTRVSAATQISDLHITTLVLVSLGFAIFMPWSWRWQLVLNAICLASFVFTEFINPARPAHRADRIMDFATALVVSQIGLVFAGRYRAKLVENLRALAEGEEKFHRIFQLSPDASSLVRISDRRFIDVNDQFLQGTGYLREEVIGRTAEELGLWVDAQSGNELFAQVKAQGVVHNLEARFRTREGRILECLYSSMLIEVGGESCLFTVTRDVTEENRTQSALVEVQRRLSTVVSSAPIMLWAVDSEGTITFCEGAGWKKFGVDPARLIGRSLFEVEPFRQIPKMLEDNGLALKGQSLSSAVDSGTVAMETSYSAIFDGERKVKGAIGVAIDATARTRAERMAEQSEQTFKRIFEHSVEGIMINSLADSTYLDVNDEVLRMTGYSREQLIGRNAADFWIDPARYQSLVQELMRSRAARNVEVRYRTAGGAIGETLLSSVLIELHGQACVLSFMRDMTDRRRAEEERALLASIVRSSEDAIYSVTLDASGSPGTAANAGVRIGTITSWNPGAERLLGYSATEMIGTRGGSYIPVNRLEQDGKFFVQVMQGKGVQQFETQRLRKDGSLVDVAITLFPMFDSNGQVTGAAGIVRDITERKRAEGVLRESESRFRGVFEGSLDAIQINTDDDGRYVDVNDAFLKLFEYRREDVIGTTPSSIKIWANRDEHLKFVKLMREKNEVRNFEAEFKSRSGEVKSVLMSSVKIEIAGRPCIISFDRDITDRKRAERALIQAREIALEAARLKSSFLANMSHEIRTPLNIILGYNELIAERLSELGDESQRSFLDAISNAGRRLQDTIHSILDLSKIEAQSFEIRPVEIDLAKLIELQVRDFQVLAARKGLQLEAEVDVQAAKVEFDEYCLTQALANLLQNAIKFTEKGHITLKLTNDHDGSLCLKVIDTGVGIDADYLPKLFEPFSQEDSGYSRSFEGSGLGLALTKNYLALNGARLGVESEKGVGSAFTIHFAYDGSHPMTNGNRKDGTLHPNSLEATDAESGLPLILLVEDDPDTQTFMQTMMGKHFRMLVAASGSDMRRLIESEPPIRAILMDLSLHGSEDGLTLTSYLRKQPRWKHTPIIATTAHAFGEDRERAIAAGCDGYLSKPFNRQQLMSALDKLLVRDPAPARP
jgi:PAS domain S-box-containing protein